MNRGSGLSLGSSGGPTLSRSPLPVSPHCLATTTPPQHSTCTRPLLPHSEAREEFVSSLSFLSLADSEAFLGLDLPRHQGTINCCHDGVPAHGPCPQLWIC